MGTSRDIRKDNLRLLVERFGNRTELARALRKHKGHGDIATYQSYLSQILGKSASRSVGDRFARDLEDVAELPMGWLDVPHSARAAEVFALHTALSDTAIRLAKWMDGLDPEARKHVEALQKLIPSSSKRKQAKR